ncbi:hypothetical protein [Croceicoccus naphthovorans]|uniref:Uncharacterized protein n=1 Tax=Croceicoccus naphthovorans TaxID=1348774 RepID=A0A0G3XJD4_9SPHN|nr:hypothetical protein [Croceicoccus naphthovorans]AKM10493.1 hypothetical protein AB433_11815 [Croceicoccus naphthovorans]MBB3988676.1 hypothetical protein [Croceicoccus naphthovorans]
MGFASKARHSLGLVGLSPIECAKIATFIESEAEASDCPWLVLHSDSCDALIVPADIDFSADPYQILIRLVRRPGNPPPANGDIILNLPLSASDLMNALEQAQQLLRNQSRSGGPARLQVKMEDWSTVPANDRHGTPPAFGSDAPPPMVQGSAALKPEAYASAQPHYQAQPQQAHFQPAQPAPQYVPQPVEAQPAPYAAPQSAPAPQSYSADDGAQDDVWDQIAIALYSIVQHSAPAVAEIRVDNLDMIRIDFRFRAFNARVPLEQIVANPHRVAIRSALVEAYRPPIVNLPGESLDRLFWHIGSRAFAGQPAPWIKPGDRYRLRRWPNFTELNHAVADMRTAAAIGNCFLNARELSGAAGISPDQATRTLNAYSLMGLLEIQTEKVPEPVFFATASTEAAEAPAGLLSKLRMKLGL